MPENNYPKTVSFECTVPKGCTPDAQEWLRRVKAEVKITLLSKNVLRIDYPTDIVEKVRRVNVDDCIVRLDLIAPGDRFWMHHCVFPALPQETERLILEHWHQCSYQSEDGTATYTFPEI